jgi:signal transduction histidine kinase/CheY-like chemotaxis protein
MNHTNAPPALAAPDSRQAGPADDPLARQESDRQTIEALRQANAALHARLADMAADREACRAARAAAQRLETLGHLAGGMAHDFANVLQAVLAVASLLKRNPHDPARVLRQVEMLEKAGARGSAVTGRLLAYGRSPEAGLETVELNVLLPHLRESLQPTMPGVAIAVHVAPGLPHLTTDRSQLEMTLINLANNACDAMSGSAARMALSAEWTPLVPGRSDLASAAGFICLAVRDTGCGMDPETVARASEPFFTTKPPGKGTGLGLALACRFCRQFGGTLTIDSTAGIGTTIRMYLPAGDAAPAPTQPAAASRFAIPGPVAILLQNEPVVRDGLRTGLLARGFRVIDAARADTEADPVPDLLIADLSNDQPGAAEVMRAWRQLIPGLPAVVLLDRFTTPDPALMSGAVPLLKPVAPADLADAAVRLMTGCGRSVTSPPQGGA